MMVISPETVFLDRKPLETPKMAKQFLNLIPGSFSMSSVYRCYHLHTGRCFE